MRGGKVKTSAFLVIPVFFFFFFIFTYFLFIAPKLKLIFPLPFPFYAFSLSLISFIPTFSLKNISGEKNSTILNLTLGLKIGDPEKESQKDSSSSNTINPVIILFSVFEKYYCMCYIYFSPFFLLPTKKLVLEPSWGEKENLLYKRGIIKPTKGRKRPFSCMRNSLGFFFLISRQHSKQVCRLSNTSGKKNFPPLTFNV